MNGSSRRGGNAGVPGQEGRNFAFRHRLGIEEALRLVAAFGLRGLKLFAGLDAFVSGLADAPFLGHGALTLLGDGMRGAVALARAHGGAASLDVFDAAGRRLVTLQAQAIGAGAQWTWDGRDAQGRMVSHAVVFARAQDGVGGSLRIVRL